MLINVAEREHDHVALDHVAWARSVDLIRVFQMESA